MPEQQDIAVGRARDAGEQLRLAILEQALVYAARAPVHEAEGEAPEIRMDLQLEGAQPRLALGCDRGTRSHE